MYIGIGQRCLREPENNPGAYMLVACADLNFVLFSAPARRRTA